MCEICGNPHFDYRFTSGELPEYIKHNIGRHPIRPGIQINIRNHAAHKGLFEKWEVHSRTFMFDFLVSGNFSCHISHNHTRIEKKPGSSSICYSPGQTHQIAYQSENKINSISILVDRSTLQELILDGANQIKTPLRTLLEIDKETPPLYINDRLTPGVTLILNQILSCPFTGSLAHLFMESKILELLTMRISEYFIKTTDHGSGVSRKDRDKIYEARRILETSLVEVPTLNNLARRVGMSETKLKQNFKRVFGKPVYAFFKDMRLETAREMLASGDWNVTEAAVEVGYSSLSHFSQVFRRQFGISPSRLRKSLKP